MIEVCAEKTVIFKVVTNLIVQVLGCSSLKEPFCLGKGTIWRNGRMSTLNLATLGPRFLRVTELKVNLNLAASDRIGKICDWIYKRAQKVLIDITIALYLTVIITLEL